MRILAIETSCDETAVSIIECSGGIDVPHFAILGSALYSQIEIHAKYGGVFPALAKREHAKNLIPLLKEALAAAEKNGLPLNAKIRPALSATEITYIEATCSHEMELAKAITDSLWNNENDTDGIPVPAIDLIAVTQGPGLEPALWVGLNFAKVLQKIWGIPAVGINHMEGHIVSALMTPTGAPAEAVAFPALALLISGGHTEIVLARAWGDYSVIGQTRDDAVGEAYDKIARILGLPYPGGPEVARLAEEVRGERGVATDVKKFVSRYSLPRPMISTKDLDFSFSGLKTAVLYTVRNIEKEAAEKSAAPDESWKKEVAFEFEEAVTDVLLTKIIRALDETTAKTLIVGGGVIANSHLRDTLLALAHSRAPLFVRIPEFSLATDNAVMIAIAAYIGALVGKQEPLTEDSKPDGNMSL